MKKTIRIKLDLQIRSKQKSIPTLVNFKRWVKAALGRYQSNCELTICIVTPKEMTELNRKYRHKNEPTNILSFPFTPPPGIKSNLLGDIILCASVIKLEAKQQQKPEKNHWAHLTIHGVLHLLGYDHQKSKDAKIMEQLETNILQQLNIPKPY
jgi:probable rRNA maturation factor